MEWSNGRAVHAVSHAKTILFTASRIEDAVPVAVVGPEFNHVDLLPGNGRVAIFRARRWYTGLWVEDSADRSA